MTISTSAVQRFLRYVTYDTQSDERSETFPSTEKQLVLLHVLADDLRAISLTDVTLDDYGYVMATIPSTTTKTTVPTIGLIAHVDTSPEMEGASVKPIVHERYDGRDLTFPDDPSLVLRMSDVPELAQQFGNDIITASGLTLLGSDDKAGVAEIVGVAEYLMTHPDVPHGPIRIAFTPDEEVGRGANHFDVPRFGAHCAYTLDAGPRGELEYESFSADAITVTFKGFNTHPGYAKGKMINAIRMAADFVASLPRDAMSPETTEAYEGYLHPYRMQSSVDATSVKVLVRDFVTSALKEKEAVVEDLARKVVAKHPGATVEFAVEESYRNMREVLDQHPQIIDYAREALRRCGLEPIEKPIRGGTDGSRLSFMGLPTPNLFAGQHNIHSRLEWVSRQDMDKAVEVIVELCKVWEEKASVE